MMNQTVGQILALNGANVTLIHPAWSDAESAALWQALSNLHWQQKAIRLFGKEVMQPRLVAWYGDEGANYIYSGVRNSPLPWHPVLLVIKAKVESMVNHTFNSVLCNYYRDGQDSVGWHSDDEKELGVNPVIASVSFGATRTFCLQHKKDKTIGLKIPLLDRSILVMAGTTQQFYRHAIHKEKHPVGARINLTFRTIVPSS